MNVDPSVRFRQLVDNALTHLTWHDEIVQELGVEGISQIWDDQPAWYIWLAGRAYLLRYPGLNESADELTAVLHAFPTREELASGRFSAEERRLLEPEHFDQATTTPRFESFGRFAEAFIIAEMTVIPGAAGCGSLVVSSHQQAWDAAWSFTDFFVSMQSFYRKTAPLHDPVGFAPQPGISSVLISFEENDDSLSASFGNCPIPAPAHWHRLAQSEVRCSATGTCSCSH